PVLGKIPGEGMEPWVRPASRLLHEQVGRILLQKDRKAVDADPEADRRRAGEDPGEALREGGAPADLRDDRGPSEPRQNVSAGGPVQRPAARLLVRIEEGRARLRRCDRAIPGYLVRRPGPPGLPRLPPLS